jgi:hypothetical protein
LLSLELTHGFIPGRFVQTQYQCIASISGCNATPRILLHTRYDGQGFWLCHKRLSSGKFCWWPAGKNAATKTLAAHQMQVLLSAGNPDTTQAAPAWRPVGPAD